MNALREKAAAIAKREKEGGIRTTFALNKLLEEHPAPHQKAAIMNAWRTARAA
jgi:hypothetical protein